MAININHFDCKNIGPNNVILTVIDNSGNIGTCTSVVTVNYAANPLVTPATDVICDGERTNIMLTSDLPGTSWTWTVNPSPEISGASADNSGSLTSISQVLHNSDLGAHNVIYYVVPKVYGHCDLPAIQAEVWVNPVPQIIVSPAEQTICYGEMAVISVSNPNISIRGQWLYDLTVTPDPDISGNTTGGTYTNATDLTERLINNGTEKHKVVYMFTPRIVPDDHGPECIGSEQTVTIWVHPRVRYTKEVSDYNGFNISCYGKSNGYIKINPTSDLGPYVYMWSGPVGFTASTKDISGLKAGEYILSITDVNNCTVSETFDLTEPNKLGLTINTSISSDGTYNINCAGGKTGSIDVSVFNNVGLVAYMWADGYIGKTRTNLKAGNYKVLISDSNNCQTDSAVTLTEPEPIKLAFDVTDPFCPEKPDGEIRLTAIGGISGSGYNFRWSDNSTSATISNIPAGYYSVTVTDINACSVKDSIRLRGMNKICLIIPEAISPNRDLINDVWNIENKELYPQIEITIYNRWGQAVWKSERGYPIPWDGRSRGEELPIDSYHYIIELNNGIKPIIGSITIIR
jgi:gliding motility-associated-like protein